MGEEAGRAAHIAFLAAPGVGSMWADVCLPGEGPGMHVGVYVCPMSLWHSRLVVGVPCVRGLSPASSLNLAFLWASTFMSLKWVKGE